MPLPGIESHLLSAPNISGVPYRSFESSSDAQTSAVLIPLYELPNGDDFEIILTLRSQRLLSHSGQISFPGGRTEPGESPEQTALREAFEETGIKKKNVRIIGRLSTLYVPPSNTLITPVIGQLTRKSAFKINPSEVAEILTIKLSELLDRNNYNRQLRNIRGKEVEVPYWDLRRPTPLWGATAMILTELLVLYMEFNPNVDDLFAKSTNC